MSDKILDEFYDFLVDAIDIFLTAYEEALFRRTPKDD
jgi:hypothetical protein